MSRIYSKNHGGVDGRYLAASGVPADELPVARWIGFNLKYTDFDDTDTSEAVALGTLPKGTVAEEIRVAVRQAFGAAVALTSAKLDLGFSDGGVELLDSLEGLDETSAPSADSWADAHLRRPIGPRPQWRKYSITDEALVLTGESDTNATLTLDTLPAGCQIHDIRLNLTEKFEGSDTLSDATLTVGLASDPDALVASDTWDDLDDDGGTAGWQADPETGTYGAELDAIYAAVTHSLTDADADLGATTQAEVESVLDDLSAGIAGAKRGAKQLASATALTATLTVAGGVISNLTQGNGDLYVLVSNPAGEEWPVQADSNKTIYATLTVAGDNLADMDEGEVDIYIKVSNPNGAKVWLAGDSAVT